MYLTPCFPPNFVLHDHISVTVFDSDVEHVDKFLTVKTFSKSGLINIEDVHVTLMELNLDHLTSASRS